MSKMFAIFYLAFPTIRTIVLFCTMRTISLLLTPHCGLSFALCTYRNTYRAIETLPHTRIGVCSMP